MEVLRIVAGSWPIVVLLVAAMAAGLALYVIHWFRQTDREDKAYRSQQAVVVRDRDSAG